MILDFDCNTKPPPLLQSFATSENYVTVLSLETCYRKKQFSVDSYVKKSYFTHIIKLCAFYLSLFVVYGIYCLLYIFWSSVCTLVRWDLWLVAGWINLWTQQSFKLCPDKFLVWNVIKWKISGQRACSTLSVNFSE